MPPAQKFIVGRQAEIERFEALASGQAGYWLLNIYGPGGIGKTVVFQRLLAHAQQQRMIAAGVSGDRPDLTPDRILYQLQESLSQATESDAFGEFTRQFNDYLLVNNVLRQGGGIPAMYDVIGNPADPARFNQALAGLAQSPSAAAQETLANRYALERYLRGAENSLTAAFATGLAALQAETQSSVALLVDTYEELEGWDDWFCRSLIPTLPAGVKIIFLGRNNLHRVNFEWEEFETGLHTMPLPELGEAEARAYLHHYGLKDPTAQEQVIAFTGGYPLLLVLVRHLAQEHGGWDALHGLERSADRDHIATELLKRILREERVREVRAFLEKGVVARWFNPEIIGVILEVDAAGSRMIYDKLRRHSFIEPHPYGLKFHDKIRELLLERLKFNQPEYDQIVQRLLTHYADQSGLEPEPAQATPPGSTFNINIEHAQGLVIGDHGQLNLLDPTPPQTEDDGADARHD